MNIFKLLVIDDSNILNEGIRKILEGFNCEVTISTDGLTGIKTAVELKPDVIFLDLVMPNFIGADALKALKAINTTQDIPVVIITAHRNFNMIAEIENIGVAKVLFKPLTRSLIISILQEILGSGFKYVQNDIVYINENIEQARAENLVINDEAEMIKEELYKFFMKSIDVRKKKLQEAVDSGNGVMLKAFIHELRGVGTMIGYGRLTEKCEEIESIFRNTSSGLINWLEVKQRVLNIIAMFELMEKKCPT